MKNWEKFETAAELKRGWQEFCSVNQCDSCDLAKKGGTCLKEVGFGYLEVPVEEPKKG